MAVLMGDGHEFATTDRRGRILVDALVAVQLSGFVIALYLALAAAGRSAGVVDERSTTAFAVVAALAVAVSFARVRRGARFVANRLAFGTKAAPLEALTQLSDSIVSSPDEELMARLCEVVVRATGSRTATVRGFEGEHLRDVATFPATTDEGPTAGLDSSRVDVVDGGEHLGEIVVCRPHDRPLRSSDAAIMRDLAALAATSFRSIRLRTELRAQVAELEAASEELRRSRRRILDAQHDERRRLERDIHDGGQQHLSALGIKLTHARLLAGKRPSELRAAILELEEFSAGALTAMNDLISELRPESLARDGVVAGLRTLAERYPFDVEVSGTSHRYPETVESTLYFACAEALQNAAKHAKPTRITVRIDDVDGHAAFAVEDDGVGFDALAAEGSSVVRAISDRVAALGGRVVLASEPGAGTRVSGSLPVSTGEANRLGQR